MKISTASAARGVGFFAHTQGAQIKNLTIAGNIDITATNAAQTGGLIGQGHSTELSGNIRSEVNITVKNTAAGILKTGGIVGEWTNSSRISNGNLSYKGTIKVNNQGDAHTGGIIGGIITSSAITDAKCTVESGSTISTESQTGVVWMGGFLGNSAPSFLTDKLPDTSSQMLGILSAKANGAKDAIICYMVGWSQNAATTKGFSEVFKNNANYTLEGSTVTSASGKAYKNGEEVVVP